MTPIPKFVDPRIWAERGNTLHGKVPFKFLPELQSMLAADADLNDAESIVFELVFSFDERMRPQIKGGIQAAVPLTCQRCMHAVTYPLDVDVLAYPVGQRVIDSGEWEDDFVYHENETGEIGIDPLKLIEEEIILALPLIPMHDQDKDECELAWRDPDADRINAMASEEKVNPFAVLAELKPETSKDDL